MTSRHCPRVLLVHRRLHPNGGGNAVAAWAIQALKDCTRLTVLMLEDCDYEEVRRTFGAALREGDFEVVLPSRWKTAVLERLPIPGEQLCLGVLMTEAQRILRRREFDAVLGTDNEADFGRVGLQYVHYPWHRAPLADEIRPIHRVPGLLRAYRWLAGPALGVSLERVRSNRTLANSGFVAGKIREAHGIDSWVLYPPVPGGFPKTPWAERQVGFVGIGRLHPVKRWLAAFEVIQRVRARDLPATLSIVGFPDRSDETAKLRRLAETHPWFSVHAGLPREEMVHIVASHRYGLHMMREEHFGIGVGELLRAGCIPFVHNSGGPPDIVGGHRELLFGSDDDAVERIAAVLGDQDLQADLLARLEPRREEFSEERFMAEIRREVGALVGVYLG